MDNSGFLMEKDYDLTGVSRKICLSFPKATRRLGHVYF